MRILKFGGTSVATAERRSAIARIVQNASSQGPIAVVTSALAGVTDQLHQALQRAVRGDSPQSFIAELRDRHCREAGDSASAVIARRELARILADLEAWLTGVALIGECPPATRHRCLAAGERLALPLLVTALENVGVQVASVDGAKLIVARGADCEGDPELDLEASRARSRNFWEGRGADEVIVTTGFVAGDVDGRTVTLGRGSSDLTATLLASFLDAEAVELWTDVDGMLSAPPSYVPEASVLPHLSYDEAASLALFGAEVLHPETLVPVAKAGIPVWIRNTSRPEIPGTRIDSGAGHLTGQRAVTLVPAAKHLRLQAPWSASHFASQALETLDGFRLRPYLIDYGNLGRRLDLFVAADSAERAEKALIDRLATQGVQLDVREVAIVVMIGDLQASPEKLTSTLGDHGIDPTEVILSRPEPGSPIAARVVLDRPDGPRAVRILAELVSQTSEESTVTPLASLDQAQGNPSTTAIGA